MTDKQSHQDIKHAEPKIFIMPIISTSRWPIYLEGIRHAKWPCNLLETGRIRNPTNAYFMVMVHLPYCLQIKPVLKKFIQ